MQDTSARWLLVAAALLFSTGGAAIKWTDLGGWQVAGGRSAIAVLALLLFLREARAWPSPEQWLVGAAQAGALVLFALANKLTTSANSIFLQSTAPIWIVLAAPVVLGERARGRDLAFLLVMASGLVVVFLGDEPAQATAPDPSKGNLLAILSGVAWAGAVIGFRKLATSGAARRDSARNPAIGALVAGNTLAAALGLAMADAPASASIADLAVVLYLGVFQIGLAYLCVVRGLARVGALEASLLLLLEPVLNPVFAFIAHGERLSNATWIGGGVLLLAMVGKAMVDAHRTARSD
jgi:drug/metabolite transporter (DMT)-like permease